MQSFYDLCNQQVHAFFFSKFLIKLYRHELMATQPGAWVLNTIHPAGAQFKSLISNTARGNSSVFETITEGMPYQLAE